MNRKLQVWFPLLFALVMSVGMSLGYKLRADTVGDSGFLKNNGGNSVQEILNLVKNRYVDSVQTDSLSDDAINAMLHHLDPHTVYIPAKEVEEANEDLKGNFQGIGVEFKILSDTVNIVSVVSGGPSEKAGLMIGDKLLKVGDTARVAGVHITSDHIKQLLRGPDGSDVNVTVLRSNKQETVKIKRGIIPLPSVDAVYMIEPGTGFIHLNKFSETTYPEFMDAMKKLQQQNMNKLILDLRGNGGGVLQEAINIADEFLDGDKLIVYTKGAHTTKTEYHCEKDGVFEKGQLVVLIDETTASASEVLSGALQDWDRATIIGRRSFGKGLVQQPFILSDGGSLRLTIARYYTPLGRNIQKPYDKGFDAYEDELMQRFNDGEVVHGDTSTPTGQAFKTKAGHIVYGGGGITPDIFVPFDTSMQVHNVMGLYMKGTFYDFVYKYYVDNADYFRSMKSPADFYKNFQPGDKEWQQLVQYARKDSIDLSGVNNTVKEDVLKNLKSRMAMQAWKDEGYYEVANHTDQTVQKALSVLNNSK